MIVLFPVTWRLLGQGISRPVKFEGSETFISIIFNLPNTYYARYCTQEWSRVARSPSAINSGCLQNQEGCVSVCTQLGNLAWGLFVSLALKAECKMNIVSQESK